MINEPVLVACDGYQMAWLEVVKLLAASQWELRNLMVQIKNPVVMDMHLHARISAFADAEEILNPKHVAYTIFPHGLYRSKGNATALFTAYNRPRGLFDRIKTGWGTYFRRMTHYAGVNGTVNQLERIITAIQDRENLSKAAYTIVIQNPGGETVRPLGGPCLNYIAIQAEPGQTGQPLIIGLLAVYRNHDFLKRAYGNYWGYAIFSCFWPKKLMVLRVHLPVSHRTPMSERRKQHSKRWLKGSDGTPQPPL